jgi:D-alanyl-D-alanine carboxypeptidase/D-alanyl-D-alanine-endopeptidase (penicillin-binding protein 4)
MKYQIVCRTLLVVFLSALLGFGLLAQEEYLVRVIATPTLLPTPLPNLLPTKTPKPSQTPTSPGVSTPSQRPTPEKSPKAFEPIRTLSELQLKIRQVLSRPSLQRCRIGIKIVSLDTGKIIFDEDSTKYFMPASNMKNFTVATALEKLTPNFRFVTSVYAPSAPDQDGLIKGDLIVFGRGDPTIFFGINSEDDIKGMEKLAEKIASTGVKRIEGDLIGDESYFTSSPIPYTWEWDDLQWYYGAQVSALSVNDNSAKLTITPSQKADEKALVQVIPPESGFLLINEVKTIEGNSHQIQIRRKLGTNILEVSGSIGKDAKPFEAYVALPNPALTFVSILRSLLEQKGIIITGETKTVDSEYRKKNPLSANLVELTKLESPPLGLIAQKTMKPSQNLYTELILRAMGEFLEETKDLKKTSLDKGIVIVDKFLQEIGVPSGSVLMYDASGLSRHNLVTPDAVLKLYLFMKKSRFAESWYESLTIAGIDGTLKERFKGTLAEKNVRGKTGTINQVAALSGYVTTLSGEKLVFSIIVNNLPDLSLRVSTIDEIVLSLANFAGKSDERN